jgi:hypothetical protein
MGGANDEMFCVLQAGRIRPNNYWLAGKPPQPRPLIVVVVVIIIIIHVFSRGGAEPGRQF